MSPQPSRPELDQLLRMAANAAHNGNRGAARALFLALGREHPNDPRVWVGLAGVAADAAEQRQALERALALDPQQQMARAALDRLDEPRHSAPADSGATLVLPETLLARTDVDAPAAPPPAPEPDEPLPAGRSDEEPQAPPRFPLLNLIATAIILVLLAVVGVVIGRSLLAGAEPPLSPTMVLQIPSQPSAAGSLTTTVPPATAAPSPAASPAPSASAIPASPAPSASAIPASPAPSAAPAGLPLGTILDVDGWSATLLRPDYALSLDGSIGGIQPAGRFVLTILAVSNNSAAPRRLPADFFALSDAQGRRYSPLPGASSAFLTAYGRGQYGDLALEDEVEALSGMRTIPVLFDVPPDASGLTLNVSGAAGAGWPIDGTANQPAGP